MCDKTCQSCHHYKQHYCLDDHRLFRIYCGHCVYLSKSKTKRPYTKACENFMPGKPDTDAFVTREYLNKALLHYVLTLPFLPEIQENSTKKKLP